LNTTFGYENINSSFDNFLLPLTSKYSCYDCLSPKQSSLSSSFLLNNNTNNSSTSITSDEIQLPNKALLSFIILLGTCFIAMALKRFRRSNFFGRTVILLNIIFQRFTFFFILVKTNIE
jgi:hypothetical protein